MAENTVPRLPGKPTGRTLADIAVIRNVRRPPQRYTGADLARLIDATEQRPGEWEPYVSEASIVNELDGLAAILGKISVVEDDDALALGYVEQALRRIATRVLALRPCENARADWWAVESSAKRP